MFMVAVCKLKSSIRSIAIKYKTNESVKIALQSTSERKLKCSLLLHC